VKCWTTQNRRARLIAAGIELVSFEVRPFEGAGPLRFGMTSGEVHAHLGAPRIVRRNRRGELDEDYSVASAGYAGSDERLVEVAFTSAVSVTFGGANLFRDDDAVSVLVGLDGGPLAGLDIIVFPSLGIALADYFSEQESDRVITVFAKGRWTKLKGFVPFLK